MTYPINTRDQAKARARAIRTECAKRDTAISHAEALERVAAERGHSDWNRLAAALSAELERPFQVGDRVRGTYLKQDFSGSVLAVRARHGGNCLDITIAFDTGVDVVAFPGFSNVRRRVSGTLSRSGVSHRKTGDGVPQLVVSNAGFPAA